jgi:hypothetical protein
LKATCLLEERSVGKIMKKAEIIDILYEHVGINIIEGKQVVRTGKRFKLTDLCKSHKLSHFTKDNVKYVNGLNLGAEIKTELNSKIISLWLKKLGITLKKITVRMKGKNKFDRKYLIKSIQE